MNLKELFTKLFKKRSVVQDTLALIDINSIIDIPTRKKYKGQDLFLKQIDEYKNEYKELLSSNRTLTSIDLHSNSLKEKTDVLLDILKNSYFKEGGISTLEIIDDETLLFKNVNQIKLCIYKNELDRLQNEIELRLIALDELSREINKSKSQNKSAIESEINNLAYSYLIYYNQQLAISNSINSYITIMSNTKVNKKEYKEARNAKLKRIKGYAVSLLPDISKKISTIEDKDRELAFYEYYLELFAHNKENIGEAKRLIKSISREAQIDNLRDNETREYLYKQIKDTESIIRTVYDFNKGNISEEEIKSFYNAKYMVLTSHLETDSPFASIYDEYRDNEEYVIYEKIIQEKIEKVVNGNISPIFKSTEVYTQLLEILKTNGMYDVDAILTNQILLRFLNLCSKVPLSYQEVRNYFDSVMIDVKKDFSLWNHKNGIVLTPKISISCMEFLAHGINPNIEKNIIISICEDEKIENSLKYKLYKLYTHLEQEIITFNNQIPEGIRFIGKPGNREHALVWANINNKIKSLSSIGLPNTMEEFGTNILLGQDLNVLELNEGLSKLYTEQDSIIKIGLSVWHLYIPSTLENMDWHYFKDNSLRYITFTNFKDSKVLKNRKIIRTLLARCCRIHADFKDTIVRENGRLENPQIDSVISFILTDENDRSYRYLINNFGHPVNWTGLYEKCDASGYVRYPREQEEIEKIVDLFYQKLEELNGFKIKDKEKGKSRVKKQN